MKYFFIYFVRVILCIFFFYIGYVEGDMVLESYFMFYFVVIKGKYVLIFGEIFFF